MILTSFFRALGQIDDPRFRKVLLLGLGLTIALLVAACAVVFYLVGWATGDALTLPLVGEVTWIGDFLSWGSIIFMMVLSVFLMVPVTSAITSLFLDEVADAVEARHYAHLPPSPRAPFADALRDTINFLGVILAANLVAIVFYVLLPFAALFIFYAMNGYLLGREYFQLSAMRRLGPEGATALRKKHTMTIWAAGVLMAIPLTVPLVNLLVPIIGAATFTHIFHHLNARSA